MITLIVFPLMVFSNARAKKDMSGMVNPVSTLMNVALVGDSYVMRTPIATTFPGRMNVIAKKVSKGMESKFAL